MENKTPGIHWGGAFFDFSKKKKAGYMNLKSDVELAKVLKY